MASSNQGETNQSRLIIVDATHRLERIPYRELNQEQRNATAERVRLTRARLRSERQIRYARQVERQHEHYAAVWANEQKELRRCGLLSQEHIDILDATPGWEW